ncbi:MAG: hypothetical protein KAY71_00510 [Chromatiaceae bacterium]|nr:hypothetical protein [Chromatiaceae bacterium]
MTKPAPLVRIINHGTRWVAFGDYQCGTEYDVTPDVAERLALRGFVPVAPPSAPVAAPPPARPQED